MWKRIIHARAVSIMFLASFALGAGGALWAYFSLRHASGTPLILHFDDLSGITSVGGADKLTFTGVFGVAIIVINYLIALEFDARDRFLGKLTSAVTLVFALLLFLAFVAIINVN